MQVLPLGAMQGRRLIYSSSTDSCKPLRGSCAQADITHKLVDGSKTLQIRCVAVLGFACWVDLHEGASYH